MKKKGALIFLLVVGIVVGVYKVQPYYAKSTFSIKDSLLSMKNDSPVQKQYFVQANHKIKGYFNNIDDAIKTAKNYKRSVVVESSSKLWKWNNYAPFIVITEHGVQDFDTLESAVYYANRNSYDKIFWKDNYTVIWDKNKKLPEKVVLDVPFVKQYPELPRGCEVTSLTMILNYFNKGIDKMELAQKITKDTTEYKKDEKGRITFGNPYDGFVGDMYNITNPGYGVYHGPIAELANIYMPGKVIDFTGVEFEDLLLIVSKGIPVWVVSNSTHKTVPESMFEIWHTPTGIVKITYREHAVVLTGYSKDYVYINDPLKSTKNIRVKKSDFIDAWHQMGSQAVVIYEENI